MPTSMRRFRLPACVPVLVAVLASCATTPPEEINQRYRDVLDQRMSQYRLKDGDMIEVQYFDEDEARLNQGDILILDDGRVDMFFRNNWRVEDMTIPEFEAALREAVKDETGGLEPEISVRVTPRGDEVMMIGEFTRPGNVPLSQGMTLRDAIGHASGVRITSAPWAAVLTRRYNDRLHPEVFTIDLFETSEEIELLPGDQIELDRNIAAYVIQILQEYVFGILPSQFAYGAMGAAAI